ncbi:hypothetical protein GCM10027277_10670 [Pseudoduganella ginsengisoli]|uniref:Uncharacterized protein n=1 Tax=Pseudoduganella ginsengisoli TaxID=1462440 RepID=A0A6L6PV90_9BURK|nr:hypothetical protein [Pseudoduganella ginsengisoli]MTW01463.1 hypothetical protein [Pseudoduganella ginsengisoli]
MQKFSKAVLAALVMAMGASAGAQAAATQEYVYTPAAGVHEVKYFHACYDTTDPGPRTKVNVVMKGLATGDVRIAARTVEAGQPSTEMITFRLKNLDASLSVQFRSNDGPHCQQGVQSITFTDAVLRGRGELNALR